MSFLIFPDHPEGGGADLAEGAYAHSEGFPVDVRLYGPGSPGLCDWRDESGDRATGLSSHR